MICYEEELETLIKAKARVIEVVSSEWQRIHGFANYVAEDLNIEWYCWNAITGLQVNTPQGLKTINSDCLSLSNVLDFYFKSEQNMILVIEDPHPFLQEANPINIRYLKEAMKESNYSINSKKTIILSCPIKCIPLEISKELPIIEVDLPDRDTLAIIANSVINQYKKECITANITPKLLQSALGLTIMEARLAFATAIINNHELTEKEIPFIIKHKEQIIKKSGLLEYYHPCEYLDSVGGLDNLKSWIRKRTKAYSDEAKTFGLNSPRGVLLLGVPGCGKSLIAKAIANEWQFPLLRFDLGKVYGGIIGESERNIRYALEVAKTISPCILWIDEIEKGLSGSNNGNSDAGTSARVFGTFLTWLQEKTEPVFVVATANDISHIPVELLRKGRFDEIFFVDLPSKIERINILNIHLNIKKRNADALHIDLNKVADATLGFSGAEIAEVVNEALFNAYSNKQDLTTECLIDCALQTTPLSTTMAETINQLRQWAKVRARLASSQKSESIESNNLVPILNQEQTNPFIKKHEKKD